MVDISRKKENKQTKEKVRVRVRVCDASGFLRLSVGWHLLGALGRCLETNKKVGG